MNAWGKEETNTGLLHVTFVSPSSSSHQILEETLED